VAKKRIECILVVEDDRAIRDIIVAILRKAGYEQIVTAGNAEEAMFYVFKDTGLFIRLAIVDLMLPNTSGLTLIRKVREAKAPWRKAIPVVVLTSRTDTETYKLAAKRGIQAYLMKPISPALLTETAVKPARSPGTDRADGDRRAASRRHDSRSRSRGRTTDARRPRRHGVFRKLLICDKVPFRSGRQL